MDGVKHYLIDDLEPTEQYDVEMFQRKAREIIENNNPIILAGGTGLYVQSVLFNYQFDASKRDNEFENKFKDLSDIELYDLLKEKDPTVLGRIHPNNRKRVLRALEVLNDTNNSITTYNGKNEAVYDSYIIYLNVNDRDVLYDRINKRVDKMVSDGLIDEVKSLYDLGIMPHAIGYKELVPYFQGDISLDAAIEEIKKDSRHLAKRQITWFKNQMPTHFYEVNLKNIDENKNNIIKDLDNFLGA